MPIECITTVKQLAAAGIASVWNRLAAHSPFSSRDWLEAWWRHFGGAANGGQPGDLLTLVVRDEIGQAIGLAPWWLDRSSWTGRVLRFLGSHGVCSDYLGVLAEPRKDEEVAATLADWLTGEAAGQWDLIDLDGIDAEDRVMRQLAAEMKSRGCLINLRPGPSCWRIDLPDTWDGYVAQLSRPLRKRVRRIERNMFESGRAVLLTVEREDELPRAMEILVDLHQRRQISIGNTGSFASRSFTDFHRDVTRRFLRRGRLRLHWLELDGRPVAAEYGLASRHAIFSYQGGFDPRLEDESPGQLATVATIKLAIAQRFAAFDFLRGDEQYKAHWRATPRASLRIRIVADHASARIRHGVWVAARTLKDQLAGGLKHAVAFPGHL